MPRCPHCMAPMSGRFSICETCGRIVSGASGLQTRISRSNSIGGIPPTPRARRGPPPGSAMGGRPLLQCLQKYVVGKSKCIGRRLMKFHVDLSDVNERVEMLL